MHRCNLPPPFHAAKPLLSSTSVRKHQQRRRTAKWIILFQKASCADACIHFRTHKPVRLYRRHKCVHLSMMAGCTARLALVTICMLEQGLDTGQLHAKYSERGLCVGQSEHLRMSLHGAYSISILPLPRPSSVHHPAFPPLPAQLSVSSFP